MNSYNPFYAVVAGVSTLAGIGAIFYGLTNHDIEIIAGGFALGFIGNGIGRDQVLVDRTDAERERTKLLKKITNLEIKIKED